METQTGSLAYKMDTNQAKADINQANMEVTLKEIRANQRTPERRNAGQDGSQDR
jgi:hypothetical protein